MSIIGDLISIFNGMGKVPKIIVGCCAVYLVLMVIILLGHAILGIPMDPYTEETETQYADFDYLDLNGDGGLSFDELKNYSYNYDSGISVSESDMQKIFRDSDQNLNGVLKGGEFDHYVLRLKNHVKDLENQKKKAQREAQENAKKAKSSSSSSSNYNPFPLRSGSSSDGDGAETCPYCGSEAIYESGGSYKCGSCGRTISNPDDLNLNYDEGYYGLTVASIDYSMKHC